MHNDTETGTRCARAVALLLVSALFFTACADGGGGDGGGMGPNTNINVQATAPEDAGANVLSGMQSEPRIARAEVPDGGGASRYVLAYNDTTDVVQEIADAGVLTDGSTYQGWAESSTGTGPWTRHAQMSTPNGFYKLTGDPWLAARGSTVLMVGMGQKKEQGVDLYFPMLWISNNAGLTFGAPHALTQGCSSQSFRSCVDGPKIALSHDASRALLVWHDDTRHPVLMVLSGFANDTVNVVRAEELFDPLLDDDADNPGLCPDMDFASWDIDGHPQAAIGGLSNNVFTLYFGYSFTFQGCGATSKRHVVFRSRDEGQSWQRVMSVPASINTPAMYVLNGGDPGLPFFGRQAVRPTIAVSRHSGHDVLLLAAEHPIDGNGMEPNQMKIRQYRLVHNNGAEGCTYTTGDLTSCGATLTGLDVDQSFQANGGPMVNRKGAFEFFPAYFTGDASAEDARVGLVWYTQPLRGLAFDADIQTETIVEGAIAYSPGNVPNAGAAYGPVKAILAGSDLLLDNARLVGQYFLPCGESPSQIGSYFGDYIGGAFSSSNTNNLMALGAWTDSRFGCLDQRRLLVRHQHVVVGGLWF